MAAKTGHNYISGTGTMTGSVEIPRQIRDFRRRRAR